MANNENLIPIPGRLHSVTTDGISLGANEVLDDTLNKDQATINSEVAEDISDLQEIVGEGSVDTRIENAIKALDATETQTAGTDGLALSITETDGKITNISGSIAADTYDSYGSASAAQEAAATDATTKVNAAKAELLGDAASDYNTLGKLEDAIQSEASTRETEIGTDSTAGSVKGRIKSLETLVGSTDVDSQIDAKINALDSTKSQTAGADGLALSIEEEDGKIKSISGSIAANTYDAYGAASTAKSDLLGDAASDYNTLGKLEDAIQAEATTRGGETEALDGRLDDIEEVIPSAATSSNQLADKAFVNSSISSATAEYQGSYNSVSDLSLSVSATHAQIATALGTEISGADNNDYCFVQIPTADTTPTQIDKVERYKYNGTAWSFEYELNNSGYTDAQWAAINSGITSNLVTAFGNKYDKPSTGIPSTDMTSDVQTSLGKADSAYQKPSGGIPDSDLTSAVQTSLGKADTAYQKPSGGIPSSDLAEGVIPDISGKANKSEMSVVDGTGADADKTTITIKEGTSATVLKSHQDISGKQDVIDSTHKLAADLVDDTNSTNKFTNATEKQTWNAKQDALTFNTTPSADNKVATMADIEDATENCAYLEENDSSAVIADFDPQTDTVWKKAQTLSNAEKSQVKTNLGLPQEIYSKTEVNGLITTPNQQYVTVTTYASLPATGSADTIYRVSNYNGSTNQVDATMYSEYAWNGSDYTFLCVKSQIGEVFDITAYNSNTKYADLAAALGTNGANVPEGVRKGGMSVKYVSNSDNNYQQYICDADSFTTDVTKWAICNDEVYMQTSDWIYVIRDKDGHILAGLRNNGKVDWALGVPTPVKEYVDNCISLIRNGEGGTSLDGLNKIITFLAGFFTSDTLQALLNAKKDKNDPLFDIVNSQDISDLSEVTLDKDGKIIESTDLDGNVQHNTKHSFKEIDFENLGENSEEVIADIVEEIIQPSNNEVVLSLENGAFNGAGDDAASTKFIRTQKIQCDGKSLVIAICPNSMKIQCNLETSEISRKNMTYCINAGVSVICPTGFIRFGFMRNDESILNIKNLTEAERNGIHVYMLKGQTEGEVSLAAYDSPVYTKAKADFVCTDSNAQYILNACLSCIGSLTVMLYRGKYNLYKVFSDRFGRKCALKTQDSLYGVNGKIELKGESAFTSTIFMTEDCFNLYDSDNEGSLLSVPCRNEDGVSIRPLSNTYFSINNLAIKCYDYSKPIVGLNLAFSQEIEIYNINYGADGYNAEGGLPVFRTMPHEGCVGFRVGYGSNNGSCNSVKHCRVIYCYKGVSCAGEHYVFEDVLTHHCYIGWAFGDYHTTGHFEHPNVMIGCSIEGCYRLMYLTKGGITTEGEFVSDSENNLLVSTLVCIGLSTEEVWSIPTDELVEGGATTQRTLPILEVLKGAYRGRIELDTLTSVFENGSGRAFTWRKYYDSQTIIGHGNTIDTTIG